MPIHRKYSSHFCCIASSYLLHDFACSFSLGWISQGEIIRNNKGPDALHWTVCQFQSCNYFHSWWYVLMHYPFLFFHINIYLCLSPLQGHLCLILINTSTFIWAGDNSQWKWFYIFCESCCYVVYSDCTVQLSSYTLITFGINPASQT